MPPSPYAGFWLRFVAHLIDNAILCIGFGVFVLIAIVFLGLGFIRGLVHDWDHPDDVTAVMALGFFMVCLFFLLAGSWLYYAWMESSTSQGTLGKMALGLTVTDIQVRRVSFGRASGRFFAKFITGLIPLWIGYIMAGFTKKKQALHDMIADCLVLKKV
jgi:uncharacterized RDD family membrane protein YckC